MAIVKISDMTALAAVPAAADLFEVETSGGSTRKATMQELSALPSYAVASLPANAAGFRIAYATDGRRDSEGVGAGSGCPVYDDGSDWRTFYDNSVVAA